MGFLTTQSALLWVLVVMQCNYIYVFVRWIYVNLIVRAQVHTPKIVDSLLSFSEGTSWASLKHEGQIIILLIIAIIIFSPNWRIVESQGSSHCVRWFTLVAPSATKCYCHIIELWLWHLNSVTLTSLQSPAYLFFQTTCKSSYSFKKRFPQ